MIYLSGPITGRPLLEMKSRFLNTGIKLIREAAKISEEEVRVLNPSDLSGMGLCWETYMKIAKDVLEDPQVDAICMMKDWEKSEGCLLEFMWARARGLHIIYEAGALRA